MYTNNKPIADALAQKKVLVAAHRGTCGGISSGIPAFPIRMPCSTVRT